MNMKKIGRQMSILMGVTLSFFLSLTLERLLGNTEIKPSILN